jgi:hypothetical protein
MRVLGQNDFHSVDEMTELEEKEDSDDDDAGSGGKDVRSATASEDDQQQSEVSSLLPLTALEKQDLSLVPRPLMTMPRTGYLLSAWCTRWA